MDALISSSVRREEDALPEYSLVKPALWRLIPREENVTEDLIRW